VIFQASRKINRNKTLRNELLTKEYLETFTTCFNKCNWKTCSNPPGIKHLHPFVTSVDLYPDVFMEETCDGISMSVLLVEVHSGHYKPTLAKLCIIMIDQLRLLRNYVASLSECVGFVFPKLSKEYYVTKVTLTWTKDFGFKFECYALEKTEVGSSVNDAVRDMRSRLTQVDPSCTNVEFFIPLSQDNLALFPGTAKQVPSKSSIIVSTEEFYFKHVLNSEQKLSLVEIEKRSSLLNSEVSSILAYDDRIEFGRNRINFFCFKTLPFQLLSTHEAKDCLIEFVDGVYKALTVLHTSFCFAHLDIRLDNICFNHQFQPVLIDLDRAQESMAKGRLLRELYSNSVMYEMPQDLTSDHWLMIHSDFRQLG